MPEAMAAVADRALRRFCPRSPRSRGRSRRFPTATRSGSSMRRERDTRSASSTSAPESSQKSGGKSTARLQQLVGGKKVKVSYSERDKYGRLFGTVWFGGEDVNYRMVAEGMA